MARVIVFAATGKTGSAIVRELLAEGHQVTAYSRRPVETVHDNLTSVVGEITEAAKIEQAIQGQECIVGALGHDEGQHHTIENWAKLVIPLGKSAGVDRIVAIGGKGLLQSFEEPDRRLRDGPQFPDWLKPISADHLACLQLIEGSGLQWMMMCPPRILPGDADGLYGTELDRLPTQERTTVKAGNIGHFIAGQIAGGENWNHRVYIRDIG